METITIIKLKKCQWCGSEFIPRHNRQTYCTNKGTKCKNEARREQVNRSRMDFYKKYGEKNTIGTSNLSENRNKDTNKELFLIHKEMKRIGIKS